MDGGCILCERHEHYEMADKSKVTTWYLAKDGCYWSLLVTIENVKLGFAMTAKVPVERCPECGRELS